jgi:hypothetical protein
LLAPTAALPWPLGFAGVTYGVVAVATGAVMILLALQVLVASDVGERYAKRLFAFSILYLFLLFAVLFVEQGLRFPPGNVHSGGIDNQTFAQQQRYSTRSTEGGLTAAVPPSLHVNVDCCVQRRLQVKSKEVI